MERKLSATPAALETIGKLERSHGPLAFFQSGGCCDGSLPICIGAEEMQPGPNDLLLGEVGGVPFYVDAEQYRRWGEPRLVLDVAPGAPEGFSLGKSEGVHFVSLTPRPGCAVEPG